MARIQCTTHKKTTYLVGAAVVGLAISTSCIVMSSAEPQLENQVANHPAYHKPIPPENLKTDLDFLFKTIEEVHPNMYAYTSKAEFDPLRAQLYKSLNHAMTPLEFYKITAPVIASLKSFHTMLFPFFEQYKRYARTGGRVFPMELRRDGSNVVIYKNYSTVDIPAGGTVLSINGRSASQLFTDYAGCVAAENKKRNPWYIENPVFLRCLLWLEYGHVEEWNLRITSTKGVTNSYSVPALAAKEFTAEDPAKTAAWERHYRLVPEHDVAMLKFYKWREPEELDAFFDSSFQDIHSRRLGNVIIDIRENTGGGDDCFHGLLQYLTAKPYRLYDRVCIKISDQAEERIAPLRSQLPDAFGSAQGGDIVTLELPEQAPADSPFRFNGRVFLLVGPQSFSASTVFSSLVKCYEIATLIGEETGDPTTLYADSIMFELPNSGITASVPSKLLVCTGGRPDGRGVMPDYEVEQKRQDTARGVDTVLEFTLNLIKTSAAQK